MNVFLCCHSGGLLGGYQERCEKIFGNRSDGSCANNANKQATAKQTESAPANRICIGHAQIYYLIVSWLSSLALALSLIDIYNVIYRAADKKIRGH